MTESEKYKLGFRTPLLTKELSLIKDHSPSEAHHPTPPSDLGLLQLALGRPQGQLLVRLQLRGQVVQVAQLLAQLLVLQGQVRHLPAGGVLRPLLHRRHLLLQGGVGLLQVLYLWGGEGTVVWTGTL